MNVCVIGRGRVGRALQRALTEAGVSCVLRSGRKLGAGSALTHELYVLAVPDAHIRAVAERLSLRVRPPASALHCAGARTPEELASLRAVGLAVGSFHPLASFPERPSRASLAGVTFTLAGDPRAIAAARRLARRLAARTVVIAQPGAAYHAAAALLANGAVALAQRAAEVLVELGYTPRAAEQALSGLLASVADNVRTQGLPRALTGPVARGDVGTVARHLAALSPLAPSAARAYRALLPEIVETARALGLERAVARRILSAGVRSARSRGAASSRGR